MIIQPVSITNLLFVDDALNPKFFGVTSTPSEAKTVTVIPAPIVHRITITPLSVTQDGVKVDFPPYSQEVTLYPPPKQVTIPSVGGDLSNIFESVGVINPGGQLRLCALVRPNVIAAARHYNNAPFQTYIGMTVEFAKGDRARIAEVIYTQGDFECYQLDRAITSVQPAPIAPLEPNAYPMRQVIVFGLVGTKTPAAAKTTLKYAFANGPLWLATASNKSTQPLVVEKGDSGSPVFIVANGVVGYFGSLAAVNLTEFKINMASPHAADIAAL